MQPARMLPFQKSFLVQVEIAQLGLAMQVDPVRESRELRDLTKDDREWLNSRESSSKMAKVKKLTFQMPARVDLL